jgi:hypothetical protein
MASAGASTSDAFNPAQSSSGTPRSIRGETYSHLRREDRPISVGTPAQTRSPSTRRRVWPSAARAFLQRTLTRLLRQSKQTPEDGLVPQPRRDLTRDQGNPPLSELSGTSPGLDLSGLDSFTSLTPLVLRRTDDVAFSPSSFFRRVEEVRALGSNSGEPFALAHPSLQRRPPPGPRRRPPPPVDEVPTRAMARTPSSRSRNHVPSRTQTTLRNPSMRTELHSVLELQALAVELDKLDPLLVNSPPLAPHCLHASPSIKSVHPRPPLWSISPQTALNPSCDPLAELLAVADELKTMKNLDSDDILYMTDAPPASPLPPTLHAFLDAPGASLRILEMDVHREDETFLGVPIPCIVVTSEGDSLPKEEPEVSAPPSSSSEDLLAPPPTTYRGRVETDQPPIIAEGGDERSPSPLPSPSPSPAPAPSLPCCEDSTRDKEEEHGGSLSPPCYCPECVLVDGNHSWEVFSAARPLAPSSQCTKPDRPTAPKPARLLRRRERSLLRRMLGGDDECNTPSVKDMSRCIHSKRKRKRISKDTIGSPRPLSSAAQATLLSSCIAGLR